MFGWIFLHARRTPLALPGRHFGSSSSFKLIEGRKAADAARPVRPQRQRPSVQRLPERFVRRAGEAGRLRQPPSARQGPARRQQRVLLPWAFYNTQLIESQAFSYFHEKRELLINQAPSGKVRQVVSG